MGDPDAKDWERLRKEIPAVENSIDDAMAKSHYWANSKKQDPINCGKKYDGDKPRMHLIPPRALLAVGMVLTEGAKKYGDHNWKQLDNLQERYTSAALRHMMAHMAGQTYDEETNLSHLAHTICCLMFKLEIEIEKQ